jgi:uncharacterized membrane protein
MEFIVLTIVVALIIILMIYGSIASLNWRKQNPGRTTMSEHEHYYFRFFYFNPDDKRFMLYKRGGGGYTLNFASPIAILIAVAILSFMLFLLLC